MAGAISGGPSLVCAISGLPTFPEQAVVALIVVDAGVLVMVLPSSSSDASKSRIGTCWALCVDGISTTSNESSALSKLAETNRKRETKNLVLKMFYLETPNKRNF